MPRFVSVVVTHGRSIPVSIRGEMRRLQVGDPPSLIPFEIYVRYAHKLRVVEEGAIPVETADIKAADVAGVETPSAPAPPAELPTWPMRVPPDEYLQLYEKRKNPSKTMAARLKIARTILRAKEKADGKT